MKKENEFSKAVSQLKTYTMMRDNGLEVVQLKDGREAIIGFKDWEQARRLEASAEQAGRGFVHMVKRDGQEWEGRGSAYEPYTWSDYLEDYGDDYGAAPLFNAEDFGNRVHDYASRIKSMDPTAIGELRDWIEEQAEIHEAMDEAKEEKQTVLTYCGKYWKTIENEMMGYVHDVYRYEIGLLIADRSE